jgi:predicted RNase H-like nuclease
MSRIAGVDSCSWGWIAVLEHTSVKRPTREYLLCPTFEQLVTRTPGVAIYAVDIPIGLPETGRRQCDGEARRRLGAPRASSVFTAPTWSAARELLSKPAIDERNVGSGQGRTSQQLCAILHRINEVNELLMRRTELGERVFEIHPELSLQAMNDGSPMRFRKRTPKGTKEREDVLRTSGLHESCDSAWGRFLPNRYVRKDDVIDAHAALWTARRIAADEAETFPADGSRPVGGNGLQMLIWI